VIFNCAVRQTGPAAALVLADGSAPGPGTVTGLPHPVMIRAARMTKTMVHLTADTSPFLLTGPAICGFTSYDDVTGVWLQPVVAHRPSGAVILPTRLSRIILDDNGCPLYFLTLAPSSSSAHYRHWPFGCIRPRSSGHHLSRWKYLA